MPAKEVLTRRNLPHWYVPGAVHFLTYRLAGTIPSEALNKMRKEKDKSLEISAPPGTSESEHREKAHKQFFAKYDSYLDTNTTIDWLSKPKIAAAVRENLYHHHESKYFLIAYCIMISHVHVLLQPIDTVTVSEKDAYWDGERPDGQSPLAGILHSLKSYTANRANELLGRSGQFWQGESYDHWVRDDREFGNIVDYIAMNPVKAKRVEKPHDWFWSSAHDRFLQDGSQTGLLCNPR